MPQPQPPFEIVQCLTGPHAGRVGLRYCHDGPGSITGGTVIFADDHPDEWRSSSWYGNGSTEYRVIISTSDLLALINSIVQELPPVAPPERPAPPRGGLHGWVDTSDGQALLVVPNDGDVMHAQALCTMRNTWREAFNDMIRLTINP